VSIIVDITPLLEKVGKSFHIDESDTVSYPEDNLVLVSPIRFEGDLINTGSSIVLKGKACGVTRLSCARCLKEFDSPFDIPIKESYIIGGGLIPDKKEFELKEEDFAFQIEEDNKLNLSEIIRQNLITFIPIKPLCSEKCGLE